MTKTLVITAPADDFEVAIEHLRRRSENAAFFLARKSESGLHLLKTRLLTDDDVVAGGWHLELTERTRQEILQWASDGELSLVEAHSHGKWGDPARFSPTDVANLGDWVAHLRWRLPGRTYAALVFGIETFDGVAWEPDASDPVPITRIEVETGKPWSATGRSLSDFDQERDSDD